MAKCARKGCWEPASRRVRVPGPGKQTIEVCFQHAKELEDLMAKKCAVIPCDGEGVSKGLCAKHYARFNTRKWLDGIEGKLSPEQADDLDAQYQRIAEADPSIKRKVRSAAERPARPFRNVAVASPKAEKKPVVERKPVPLAPVEPVREVVVPPVKARAPEAGEPPTPPGRVQPKARRQVGTEAAPQIRGHRVLIDAAELADLRLKAKDVGALQAGVLELHEKLKGSEADYERALVVSKTKDDEIASLNRRLFVADLNVTDMAKKLEIWHGEKVEQVRFPPAFLTLLRESRPLRLALVEAMHDRAMRTLRLAAEDPASAETLLADLLATDPG